MRRASGFNDRYRVAMGSITAHLKYKWHNMPKACGEPTRKTSVPELLAFPKQIWTSASYATLLPAFTYKSIYHCFNTVSVVQSQILSPKQVLRDLEKRRSAPTGRR
jgi:hypothetical protein